MIVVMMILIVKVPMAILVAMIATEVDNNTGYKRNYDSGLSIRSINDADRNICRNWKKSYEL
jgi:hypothetical protein